MRWGLLLLFSEENEIDFWSEDETIGYGLQAKPGQGTRDEGQVRD